MYFNFSTFIRLRNNPFCPRPDYKNETNILHNQSRLPFFLQHVHHKTPKLYQLPSYPRLCELRTI